LRLPGTTALFSGWLWRREAVMVMVMVMVVVAWRAWGERRSYIVLDNGSTDRGKTEAEPSTGAVSTPGAGAGAGAGAAVRLDPRRSPVA